MKQYLSRRNIVIGVAAILVLCCIGLVVTSLPSDSDEQASDEPTAVIDEEPGDQEEEVAAVETEEPSEPTNTPSPTETPEPTNTPLPTDTPTPRPTNTPIPTPTNTPEPIILTGTGDSLVSIEKGDEAALVRISGNAGSRFFAVENYDNEGNQIDLLVNTTDVYEGLRPLDFRDGEHTAEFEVSATGAWTIEVLPLGSIERVDVPGEISGSGDYVFALNGDSPSRATITGNSDGRYFGVFSYGSIYDLLVNTTDVYEGTVRLESDTLIIEVEATGEWTISIE